MQNFFLHLYWTMIHFALMPALLSVAAGQGAGAGPCAPLTLTAEQDHQNMMDQLGIHAIRPGWSGDEAAPNHANYDPAKANPFPDLPDALILNNGKRVTTPEMWWKQRRPEIVEAMEREVYGRLPKNLPKVQLDGDDHGSGKSWFYSGGCEEGDRPRGQFRVSANQCGYFHDRGYAGAGQRAGAGINDVWTQRVSCSGATESGTAGVDQ